MIFHVIKNGMHNTLLIVIALVAMFMVFVMGDQKHRGEIEGFKGGHSSKSTSDSKSSKSSKSSSHKHLIDTWKTPKDSKDAKELGVTKSSEKDSESGEDTTDGRSDEDNAAPSSGYHKQGGGWVAGQGYSFPWWWQKDYKVYPSTTPGFTKVGELLPSQQSLPSFDVYSIPSTLRSGNFALAYLGLNGTVYFPLPDDIEQSGEVYNLPTQSGFYHLSS